MLEGLTRAPEALQALVAVAVVALVISHPKP